jgi:hypothetical protein
MKREGFTVFWTMAEIEAGWLKVVAHLRAKKQFSKVTKDGIALVWDLMNGNIDELLKQFPFVQEAMCQRTPPPPADNDDILKELEEIKLLIQDRPAADGGAIQSGPRPIAAPQFALPLIDADDDNTLNFTQQTGGGNIAGMMARVQGMMESAKEH